MRRIGKSDIEEFVASLSLADRETIYHALGLVANLALEGAIIGAFRYTLNDGGFVYVAAGSGNDMKSMFEVAEQIARRSPERIEIKADYHG